MNKVLTCLLIFVLASSPTWASPGPDQAHVDSIRKKVAACVDHQRRVVVETYDNRRLLGIISEAGADDFVINCAGHSTTLSYPDVRKVKWPSPIMKQVKVGIGAVAVVGALVAILVALGGLRG